MGSLPSVSRRRSTASNLERPDEAIEDDDRIMFVALCDYPPNEPSARTISMAEKLYVVSSDDQRYRVQSSLTSIVSHVPHQCVAQVFNRWHFIGVSRRKAEELLLMPQNQSGSFLIRNSQSSPGSYSLSVLQNVGSVRIVKHYRIECHNGQFYIIPNIMFSTLSQLVQYYSESASAVCHLGQPCFILGSNTGTVEPVPPPMSIRRPSLNWKNLTSSMILKDRRTDSTTAEPLVSDGLREALTSYIYFTESTCED